MRFYLKFGEKIFWLVYLKEYKNKKEKVKFMNGDEFDLGEYYI